jgi:hypothetical protein
MAAVRGGVCSGGSTNTRHAAHLFPLPCIGEPAAASCFSPGSSVARSKALRAAACYTSDAKTVPEVEASAGKNRNMPIAISATRGRGERYGSRQASSYGAVPLTHRRPASSSLGTRGGGGYHEPHGGDAAFSSITRRLVSFLCFWFPFALFQFQEFLAGDRVGSDVSWLLVCL